MTILHKDIHHRVELIEDGLWQIGFNFPTSTNCWLYQESDGLVLVDTGNSWNHGTILDTVERTGQPLRKIIITHAHPDHAGSAAALSEATGATVYAHKEDVKYINGTKSMASLPGSIESRLLHSTADRIGILNPSPVKNVLALEDNQIVGTLHVIHTPGHTPGSISLWSEKRKALFVGDNASNGWLRLRLNFSWFTLDCDRLKESFSKYKRFPSSLLLPGHGAAYRSRDAVADLLSLLH